MLLPQIVKLIQNYSILHVLKMDIGMYHQIVIPMAAPVQMDSFLLFLQQNRIDGDVGAKASVEYQGITSTYMV